MFKLEKNEYLFKARPVGGETLLSLLDDGIEVQKGIRKTLVKYSEIASVRITFRPSTMLNHRFMVIVTEKSGKSFKFFNTTYRGFAEMIDQKETFNPFIKDFHARLKGFNISYTLGEPVLRYYAVIAITLFLGILGMNAIIGATKGASIAVPLVLGAMYIYMLIIMSQWIKFNRPQSYNPASLPAFVNRAT